MTDVSSAPGKVALRRDLFRLAERALIADGWKVGRVPRGGKSSLREITRDNERKLVSIRTSQDTWVAFPPLSGGKEWVTLDDVDYVVVATVNDQFNPTEARVHMVPGDEARDRFNRAYAARKAAGHKQPDGRGVWIAIYDREVAGGPINLVGGGLGLVHKPLAVEVIAKGSLVSSDKEGLASALVEPTSSPASSEDRPLSMSEAKRRLALTLGVPESAIRITVEH